MDFTITYEDYFEKPIEIDSVNFSGKYMKVYSTNGIVKKKEEYNDGKIDRLIYYLDSNEILSDFLINNQSISDIETRKREYIGEYIKIYHKEYYRGKLSFENEGISVVDKSGNEIYYYSGNNSENEVRKYFFDNNGEELYLFWYYNGKLSQMDSYNPKHSPYINEFHQSFNAIEIETLEELDWKNMTYYHNAEPIIPS